MSLAFVAGATGYTGRAVVERLRARDIAAVAHVRPDSGRLDDWCTRFEALGAQVDTTPWEPAAMAATMTRLQPRIVFCLIGTTRRRGDSYDAIDYGLTKLLVDAAVACDPAPRFVYLSSAGTGPRSRSAYFAARWRAEQAVRERGLPFTIVRPSFITGPDREERRLGERLGATVSDAGLGVAALLGGARLRARYRSNTAAGLAAALVRLAYDPEAVDTVVESEGLRDTP